MSHTNTRLTILAGAALMLAAALGCAESHSDELIGDSQHVPYRRQFDDSFAWNVYQAMPKSERRQLAPLQREWIELVNQSLKDSQAAYRAKNAVARDDMFAEAVERQRSGFNKLQEEIATQGLNNWAFRVTEEGLVMGPAWVYTHDVYGPNDDQKFVSDIRQGHFLKLNVNFRQISSEVRSVIHAAETGDTLFISLPPESFVIDQGVVGYYTPVVVAEGIDAKSGLPKLAAPKRWLLVSNPGELVVSTKPQPQRFKNMIAERNAAKAAARKAAEAELVRQETARRQKIEKLTNDLAQHLFSDQASSEDVEFWLSLPGDHVVPSFEPAPAALTALKQMGCSVQDLLHDPRIAFFRTRLQRGAYAKKMQALTETNKIVRDFFEGKHQRMNRVETVVQQLKVTVQFDETSGKYLIRADKLIDARYYATDPALEGRFWRTRLAELAAMCEQGKATVISADSTNVDLGSGGLESYLSSLPHRPVVVAGEYVPPHMRAEEARSRLKFSLSSTDAAAVGKNVKQEWPTNLTRNERNRRAIEGRLQHARGR